MSNVAVLKAPTVAPVSTTLKKLFGDIFEDGAGAMEFVPRQPTEFTPSEDPWYRFTLDDLRLLLMWDSSRVRYNKNLMLTGPTGSGKTQLIFQFANRTGREVFRYSCHEKTDFTELLGGMVINKDGSTSFQLGPLATAFTRGAIFLLDEGNAARPGSLIGMNGVLDGAESITLPDGTLVKRHPEFRVAMTGNALSRDDTASAFRGTQTMNAALLDRCFVIEKDYLPMLRETQLLHKFLLEATSDAQMNPGQIPVPEGAAGLATSLVKYANEIRQQFKRGECEVTVSTRGLFAFAEMLSMRWSKLATKTVAEKELDFCAKAALIGKSAEPMQTVLMKTFAIHVSGVVKFAAKAAKEPLKGLVYSPFLQQKVIFLINPDHQGSREVLCWGFVAEASGTEVQPFHAQLTGMSGRLHSESACTPQEAIEQMRLKQEIHGYSIKLEFSCAEAIAMMSCEYDGLYDAFTAIKSKLKSASPSHAHVIAQSAIKGGLAAATTGVLGKFEPYVRK